MSRPPLRHLAHLVGVVHNLTYYADEVRAAFRAAGIRRYWHGYLAYRSAPMGRVEAPTVVATFYNFAPSLIEGAIPLVWETLSPAEAIERRDAAITAALHRVLDVGPSDADLAAVANVALGATAELPGAGRPLFAAHRRLAPPHDPLGRLWFATTLWREYRGDGHNLALAHAGVDGLECHVLLAGRGVADQAVIERIRGWNATEWAAAHQRLLSRGLVDPTGMCTPAGLELRSAIEAETDRLARPLLDRLDPTELDRLVATLEPLVERLVTSGAVPDRWPPPERREP